MPVYFFLNNLPLPGRADNELENNQKAAKICKNMQIYAKIEALPKRYAYCTYFLFVSLFFNLYRKKMMTKWPLIALTSPNETALKVMST